MKLSIALRFVAVLLLSLCASAQTVTTKQDGVQSVTISVPGSCLLGGKADVVTLSGSVRTILSITTVGGVRNGYQVWAGTLTGKGTYGRVYTATGSYLNTFNNQDISQDGDFVFTTNLRLSYAGITGGVTYHDKREFVVSNNGNLLTVPKEEMRCL
jgi:hypothetical protein